MNQQGKEKLISAAFKHATRIAEELKISRKEVVQLMIEAGNRRISIETDRLHLKHWCASVEALKSLGLNETKH